MWSAKWKPTFSGNWRLQIQDKKRVEKRWAGACQTTRRRVSIGINLCSVAVVPSIYVIYLALYPCLEPYRRDDEGQGEIISVQTMKVFGGVDVYLSLYFPRQ